MMRTSTLRPLLVLSLAAFMATAGAQQTPPKLERIEEPESPITVTPPADKERQVTEKREQGKVTEIKVKSGKSTYYLKPNSAAGSSLPGDATSAARTPQWKVMEFDIGNKKKKQKQKEEADSAPTPPPVAAPAK